jgi:hypothetical protein
VGEPLFLNAIDRISSVDRGLRPAEMGEKEGNESANQQRKCAKEKDLGSTAKNPMSAHNLKHPWDLRGLRFFGRLEFKAGKKVVSRHFVPRRKPNPISSGTSQFTAHAGPGISKEYPRLHSPTGWLTY